MSTGARPSAVTALDTDQGGVMLAIPAVPWMWTEAAAAIMRLVCSLPTGSAVAWECGSSSVAFNRNALVAAFLARSTCEWMLWLDSDMLPPPDLATRLLRTGRDFIGGHYPTRTPAYASEFRSLDPTMPDPPDGIREVTELGMGCALMHRRVLDGLEHPWFVSDTGLNSDFGFCAKIREAGHRVFVDLGTEVAHITVQGIAPTFATLWQQRHLAPPRVEVASATEPIRMVPAGFRPRPR